MAKKVLIVDDNSTSLYMLEALLKGHGFEVISAENGEDALVNARLNPPDLIVTDILMPVMDGFTLCREWKSDDTLKHIPLVFYTATYTEPKDEAFALSLGADRFILKPQEPDIIMNILKEVLGKKYMARQVVTKPLGEEMEFFRQHNEILFKKLEKKMSDLEIANQKQRENENKYRDLYDFLPIPVYEMDFEANITSANRAIYEKFGGTEEDLKKGFKAWQILTPEAIEKSRKNIQRLLSGEQVISTEYTLKKLDGSEFPAIVISSVIYVHSKPVGLRGAIVDITGHKKMEKDLQNSEELFRNLFQHHAAVKLIIDPDTGNIMDANEAAINYYGWPREQITKMKIQDVNVSNEEEVKEAIEKVRVNKRFHFEFRHRRADGSVRDVEVFSSNIKVQGKDILHSIVHDITERTQAEEALKQSEEKYRLLADHMKDQVWLMDLNLKMTYISPSVEKVLGYTLDELIQLPLDKLLTSASLQTAIELFSLEMSKALPTSLPSSLKRLVELEFRCKNGQTLWGECSFSFIRDKNGKPLSILGEGRDITERKQAEERLQQTLDSLKKAVGVTIQAMISAVEMRDPYTAGHQTRVSDLARAIATEMGLAREKVDGIRMAGAIHDIGKLSIPAEILSKPSKLTNIEFSLIKEHSQSGYEMLKNVESPWPLAEIVYQHHERMNGSGYPRNLKGDEILLDARIIAVADVVEAMASYRPYRPSLGIEAALKEIETGRGILYDDAVVDACLRLFRKKGYHLII